MLSDWLTADPDLAVRRAEPVRWGIADAVFALLVAQAAGIVVGALILVGAGYTTAEEIDAAPLWILMATQIPLWTGYAGVTLWTSVRKGHGPVVDLGWRFRRPDVPFGIVAGILLQVVVVPLLYVPILLLFPDVDVSESARGLTDRAVGPLGVATLILIVVVGAPVVEELFYRGMFLRSLERRFGSTAAMVISAVVFGAVHLQLVQFPALFVFGLVAAWLTVRTGRLGPAIWLHVGFNGTTVAVLLLTG